MKRSLGLTPRPTAPEPRRARYQAIAWSLAGNLVLLFGVLQLGWPAGNVLLLFWAENVILGVFTLVLICTARGGSEASAAGTSRSRVGMALFFVVHYGLFCGVHLAFASLLAFALGVRIDVWNLWVPIVLIAVRYLGELTTNWFLRGLRDSVPFDRVFWQPYPRVVVLHLTTLLGWFFGLTVLLPGRFGLPTNPESAWERFVADLMTRFPLDPAVVIVILLIALKLIFDVIVSGRQLSAKAG